MSEEKKAIKRGLGSARGTTRLKFSHSDAMNNGLFRAHIENVELKDIAIGEESTGMPSFNGYNIPRLVITFASNEAEANKRRYVTLSFNAVESNAENIPGQKGEWKINSVFDYLKHILDVFYLKGREFTEEEESTFSLPFVDFDEEGNYVSVEPETVIAGWRSLFTNVATLLNTGNDGKPLYISKDGKFIQLWIKLIRYFKANKGSWKKVSNGELAFPTFVGEGVMEILKANVAPTLRFDPIRECIIPKEIDETPKTLPNLIGGVQMPMSPIANFDTGNENLLASEEVPF